MTVDSPFYTTYSILTQTTNNWFNLHLQQENNIQSNDPDAVAMAILEAQRRGIKVILWVLLLIAMLI